LAGWRLHFMPEVVVPAEIPNSFIAFKSQQFRWAKGSIQTALKLLPRIIRSQLSVFQKLEAFIHLTHYALHFLIALLAVLLLPLLLTPQVPLSDLLWTLLAIPIIAATLGPSVLYVISQKLGEGGLGWRSLLQLPSLILIGFGISLSNSIAVLQAVSGLKSDFVRTPKRGERLLKSYSPVRSRLHWIEMGFGIYCLITLVIAIDAFRVAMWPFMIIYSFSYLTIGSASFWEIKTGS